MTDILVISQADKQTHLQAKKVGLTLIEAEQTPAGQALSGQALSGQALPAYDKALFVAAGMQIPWHLVEYGLHFIERWDAAAPLWRYGILAKDVGSEGERKATEQIVRDLRVPLYACELLFVKGSEAGRQLVATWEEERARPFGVPQGKGSEPRLAFLRALYRVKPIFCALPRSWMGKSFSWRASVWQPPRGQSALRPRGRSLAAAAAGVPQDKQLVRVQIAPGVYVRCYPGHEQEVVDRLGRGKRRK